jgi:hypothetical protein
MPSHTLFQPRRPSDRRIRRRAFKSVYKFVPVDPPFVYFLTTAETCAAYGISEDTLAADRPSWERHGTGNFAQPVLMNDNTFRYRRDSVVGAEPGNEFVDIMRRERQAWVEADKAKALQSRAASAANNQ